jgi:type IV pilus assembly protein PilA
MRGQRFGSLSVSLLTSVVSISLAAQTATPTPPPPQTARAALIEMFLGKGKDDFIKHLPDATREVLIRKGDSPESSIAFRISTIGREISAQGHVETFETGPNILVTEERDGHEKIEVAVEHDSLANDEDEIELSIHFYKDGQLQPLPIVPRLVFTMKQEKEIWKLDEVTVAGHIPLTDPDYLKGLRKEQDEANQQAAQFRMSAIAQAENQRAAIHPDQGFTCSLATLFPQQPQSNSPAGANLSPSLADEEANGYRFALSGCDGNPATKYRVTAVPLDPEAEIKAFCVDQSGIVKSTSPDNISNCFSGGQVVDASMVKQ